VLNLAFALFGALALRAAFVMWLRDTLTTAWRLIHLLHRFGVPHINAGDLLHSEVQRKTPLGLEAQQFMHGSKTVPDR